MIGLILSTMLLVGCQGPAERSGVSIKKLLEFSQGRAEFREAAFVVFRLSAQCPSTTPQSLIGEEEALEKKRLALQEEIRNSKELKIDVDVLDQDADQLDAMVSEAECAFGQAVETPEEIDNYRRDFARMTKQLNQAEAEFRKLQKVLES